MSSLQIHWKCAAWKWSKLFQLNCHTGFDQNQKRNLQISAVLNAFSKIPVPKSVGMRWFCVHLLYPTMRSWLVSFGRSYFKVKHSNLFNVFKKKSLNKTFSAALLINQHHNFVYLNSSFEGHVQLMMCE